MKTYRQTNFVIFLSFIVIGVMAYQPDVEGSSSKISIRPAKSSELSALGLRVTGALVVESVPSGGNHGLLTGDVIAFVNGNMVKTLEQLKKEATNGSELDILLYRNKLPTTVKSTLIADMLVPAGTSATLEDPMVPPYNPPDDLPGEPGDDVVVIKEGYEPSIH